jgi:hypothetical protein
MNAYWMLKMLRENVAESTAAHWTDAELIRKLNLAHRRVANIVLLAPGDWLVKSANITPSASLITLPSDCAKPVYLEETSSGREIQIRGTVRERRATRPSETTLWGGFVEAYLLKGYLEVNQESYTEQVTLWYQERVIDLHAGTADAGGATSLSFETTNEHSVLDDYYNGATIEVVSGTGISVQTTISDYTGSTGAATTAAGTFSTDSVYGTVSVLPEECHYLVVLIATLQCFAKPSSDIDPEIFNRYYGLVKKAEKDVEEFFSSRESGSKHVRVTEIE